MPGRWGPPLAGPPLGGGGSGGKVALVVLLVAAVVAVVGIVASQGDDDDDSGNAITDEEATAQPDAPDTGADAPEQVAAAFVDAARAQDCEALYELVSQAWLASLGLSQDQWLTSCARSLGEVVPYEFSVTSTEVTSQEGDRATVRVTADVPGGTDTLDLDLVREDGAWRVDWSTVADAPASASPASPGG